MAPQSHLSFGLFGFDSPLSYQSLPYPFPLTQEVALSLDPLPQLSWSLPPSEGRSSGCPCCSGTSEDSSREESPRASFQGVFPAPSVSADSPGALSKDPGSDICILISPGWQEYSEYTCISALQQKETSMLVSLASGSSLGSIAEVLRQGRVWVLTPSPWSRTQGRMQEPEHFLRLLPLLPWEERVHHSVGN